VPVYGEKEAFSLHCNMLARLLLYPLHEGANGGPFQSLN
jgi:hypothetical protein